MFLNEVLTSFCRHEQDNDTETCKQKVYPPFAKDIELSVVVQSVMCMFVANSSFMFMIVFMVLILDANPGIILCKCLK